MSSVAPHGLCGPKTVAPGIVQLEQIQQRIHNDGQTINKLPTELLSHIFTIGEVSDRSTRRRTKWYIGFQEVVTHVCHQWREVAIRCPNLWTYIHITRPSPYRMISLYLDRAGSGCLLDIDIEMRSRFWCVVAIEPHDWETQLHKIPYLLKFLVSRGATVDRWRSLTVCAKQPEVLYAIIGFINAKPARALQFISCRWKYQRREPESDVDEELRSLEYPHLFSESYSFSSSMMPKLRSVEFNAVPWDYIFARSPGPPLLTGLTNLSLTSAYIPCSVHDIQRLLAVNPELESLSFGISKQAAIEFYHEADPGSGTFRVRLPNLHSLSLSTSEHTDWVNSILPMIEAPVLRRLSIAGEFILLRASLDLARYLAGGKLPLQHEFSSSVSSIEDNKTAYPLLDELDISALSMMTEILWRMLFSLPTVTKIHISNRHVKQLKPVPCALPNLTHVYCSWVSYDHLGDLLRKRADAGFPIGTVHLDHVGLNEVGRLLPENINYTEYHSNFGQKLDCDESDQDSNDGWGDNEDILEGSSDELMVMTDEAPGSSDEYDSSSSTMS
ncbi:hypothetical protein B0J17DRAFT_108148 [Rhizoctonia solani]|nr:hypothetical protein B0J17DRAFT_108148 [Rhizoctonia solani]